MRATTVTLLAGTMLGATSVAHADRAVAPDDRLDRGTLQMESRFVHQERTLDAFRGTEQGHLTLAVSSFELGAAMWFRDGFAFDVKLPFRIREQLVVNGFEMKDVGPSFDVMTLGTRYLHELGPVIVGAHLVVGIPLGDSPLDVVQPTIKFGGLLSVSLSRATSSVQTRSFVAGSYEMILPGKDYDSGVANAVAAGLNVRVGPVSVVPLVKMRRTNATTDRISAVAGLEPFRTDYTMALHVGVEVAPDVTVTVSAEYNKTPSYNADTATLGNANTVAKEDRVTGMVGVSWAWELPEAKTARGRTMSPLSIRISEVTVDGKAATPVVRNELRLLIHRLRYATVHAERDTGGAAGSIRFSLRLSSDGSVRDVLIANDGMREPAVTYEASRFFDSLVFKHMAGIARLEFTVTFE